jgi:ABC-type transport system involved in multi-copper enzyme maturation permease subunit
MSIVSAEPYCSVQSRVSWGALLAGAAVGVAIYTVLALLGVAVGLTVSDNASSENIGLGAGIWAFVSLVIAMFFAGWVTTQCTVGETRTEAILYGIVVWAVTATFLVWSAATGFGITKAATSSHNGRTANSESTVKAGDLAGAQAANSISSSGSDHERLQVASWWTFFGTLLSVIAAIGGAMLGPYEFVARRSDRPRTTTGGLAHSAD